jgi:hypothetical protein
MARKKQNNTLIINERAMESIRAIFASHIAVEIRCAPRCVIVNDPDGIEDSDLGVFLMAGNKVGCFSGRRAKNGRDFIQLFFFFKDGKEVIEWLRSIKQEELRSHYLYRFLTPAQYSIAMEDELKKIMADPTKTSWKSEDDWGKYLEIPYSPDELGFVIGWSIPDLPGLPSALCGKLSELLKGQNKQDWLRVATQRVTYDA